jgi:DNA-binding beta-propeller fold protein YncE
MPATAVPRLLAPALAVVIAALGLAACGASARRPGSAGITPEQIVSAPASLLTASQPQPNGTMWALAGTAATGLYQVDTATGRLTRSVSVSNAARSVAQSGDGIIGVALETRQAGALELLDDRTLKVIRTVPLPAPARAVIAGRRAAFYVLTSRADSAAVAIVSARTGQVRGTVPVPRHAVAIALGAGHLYVLRRSGELNEIAIRSHKITAGFTAGGAGLSLAMSPDGSTLYVLKGTSALANVAVVNTATESVSRILPAPSHCRQVLVSANGQQLYEVVGTAQYGNIQVFAA